MAEQGDADMAARFAALAAIEDRHATEVADRSHTLLGHAPDPARVRWDLPEGYDEAAARGATLSAYEALAFAVRNEERAFAFFTYVAAEAQRPDVRALAEQLARDELGHAALLRHQRRRAFHAERPAAVYHPDSVEALRALARQWDADAAAAHQALAKALDATGEARTPRSSGALPSKRPQRPVLPRPQCRPSGARPTGCGCWRKASTATH